MGGAQQVANRPQHGPLRVVKEAREARWVAGAIQRITGRCHAAQHTGHVPPRSGQVQRLWAEAIQAEPAAIEQQGQRNQQVKIQFAGQRPGDR